MFEHVREVCTGIVKKLEQSIGTDTDCILLPSEVIYILDWMDASYRELASLREQVRWRKYPEEMPKRDGFYLVLENVNQVAGYYHWCKQFGWNTDGGRINIQTVTHWMPLPQPPEAE